MAKLTERQQKYLNLIVRRHCIDALAEFSYVFKVGDSGTFEDDLRLIDGKILEMNMSTDEFESIIEAFKDIDVVANDIEYFKKDYFEKSKKYSNNATVENTKKFQEIINKENKMEKNKYNEIFGKLNRTVDDLSKLVGDTKKAIEKELKDLSESKEFEKTKKSLYDSSIELAAQGQKAFNEAREASSRMAKKAQDIIKKWRNPESVKEMVTLRLGSFDSTAELLTYFMSVYSVSDTDMSEIVRENFKKTNFALDYEKDGNGDKVYFAWIPTDYYDQDEIDGLHELQKASQEIHDKSEQGLYSTWTCGDATWISIFSLDEYQCNIDGQLILIRDKDLQELKESVPNIRFKLVKE